jgi:hypothetical protein
MWLLALLLSRQILQTSHGRTNKEPGILLCTPPIWETCQRRGAVIYTRKALGLHMGNLGLNSSLGRVPGSKMNPLLSFFLRMAFSNA